MCVSILSSVTPARISALIQSMSSDVDGFLRRSLGLRQLDVAKLLGAYTSTVNTWENGHFTPDVRFVPGIVEFLGYDPFGLLPTTFRPG
jgi:transcriptional regulator with XRE-family HTH domain